MDILSLIKRFGRVALILVVGLACLWLFTTLAAAITENAWIVEFDQALATQLYATATPLSIAVFTLITWLGYPVGWIVIIGVALYFVRQRQWWDATLWLVATISGELLMNAFKAFYDRPRPVFEIPLTTALNTSFPSGHAMQSLIVYGLLAYFLVTNTNNLRLRIWIIFGAVLLVLLIGMSRLFLGVHYLSDVLGGFAAGALWLIICTAVLEFVHGRRRS